MNSVVLAHSKVLALILMLLTGGVGRPRMEKQKYCGPEETGKYDIWVTSTTRVSLECVWRDLMGKMDPRYVREKCLFSHLFRVEWLKEHGTEQSRLFSAFDLEQVIGQCSSLVQPGNQVELANQFHLWCHLALMGTDWGWALWVLPRAEIN